ncbi:hypothetical protein B4168_3054 [Anoxybacillus flavithermus]|nr:hypothetical protein B4168_3054 [Anoxybacillus flavithermus]OAO86342.1 hypothetical protein GT23_2235 [Parageobacillus thermoglucosidasius]
MFVFLKHKSRLTSHFPFHERIQKKTILFLKKKVFTSYAAQ